MSPPRPLLVGISGPSSSGKTTLSRHIRDIIPGTLILHEDDFYLPDGQIPIGAGGHADWDCIGSLDLPALKSALAHIREHGSLPPSLESKEDKNAVGPNSVPQDVIDGLRARMQGRPPVIIVDGFLLFAEAMADIRDLFDVRLFLRTDYATAKQRREARSGYVTLEGFWQDPPGYVDQIVWPNYVADHRFLFEAGDVEGELKKDVADGLGIRAMPREAMGSMSRCVDWAVGVLEAEMDRH